MNATARSSPEATRLAVPLVVGGAVAVALGVYGKAHDPTHHTLLSLFFSDTIHMKAWLGTLVVVLAVVQVLTAMRLYGKLSVPRTAPAWLGDFHRLTGTLAFVVSLPVAFHCLWSRGFQSSFDNGRTLVNSVLGCLFYGAFAAKVICVRTKRLPGWSLPVVGGLVFTALVAVWLTSSLWFFRTIGTGI
ncbi:MAG: hypothetical protein QOG64_2153 [Acidimicrobiaceae bacterium]|nr:hypothetical protein [Acidimicrobiaceae bacterium]